MCRRLREGGLGVEEWSYFGGEGKGGDCRGDLKLPARRGNGVGGGGSSARGGEWGKGQTHGQQRKLARAKAKQEARAFSSRTRC